MLAAFHNDAWDTPAYVPVGDPYVEVLADYEVSFLAPENIVIAGGGDEQHEGRLWRFTLPQARVFAFAASDSYLVDSIEQDGVTFYHYGYARHRKFAQAVLYTAARAVKLYTALYGPYPYKSLRIVETDRAQGQEYSGLVGIGTKLYDGYIGHGSRHDLIATTAHEVSHQWWFQQVGNDQVHTPWLDEAFARLSELYFYQKYYPKDADWWFKYHISGATKPTGAIDLSIYDYPDSKTYITAVYRRGLMFLNDARNLIGARDFDGAIQDYYMAEVGKVTTPDAFFDALARHTTQDLSGLVKEYFASAVALPCRISNNAIGCRR
jgi:aminopeptidase N